MRDIKWEPQCLHFEKWRSKNESMWLKSKQQQNILPSGKISSIRLQSMKQRYIYCSHEHNYLHISALFTQHTILCMHNKILLPLFSIQTSDRLEKYKSNQLKYHSEMEKYKLIESMWNNCYQHWVGACAI